MKGVACKNICTFAQLTTFDEYQFPSSIKTEPNLDFSSILHFSAAIYHHFHWGEETVFAKKEFSKSIGFQMLSWWHTKYFQRHIFFLKFSKKPMEMSIITKPSKIAKPHQDLRFSNYQKSQQNFQ